MHAISILFWFGTFVVLRGFNSLYGIFRVFLRLISVVSACSTPLRYIFPICVSWQEFIHLFIFVAVPNPCWTNALLGNTGE